MQIIKETNITKVRSKIQSLLLKDKNAKIVVQGRDGDFNRKLIETKGVNTLILNDSKAKDYMKQRDSGLNEVIAKLAAKNKVTIATDLDEILKQSDLEKGKSLARLKQNIMLCKKAKCELVFLTKQDKKSIASLMLTLGASTSQAKKSSLGSFYIK
jgi:RNase P/RNase MRP subunit p30